MQMDANATNRAENMILNRSARRFLVGAAAATALAAAAMIQAAPARTNWLLTFSETAKGSFIMGNPAAAKKLVEYASYTCSHCAEFETDVAPKLKAQNISGGNVSFEIRNLVRDPLDLTIAMLARCGGKGRFFGNHKLLMANQTSILANAGKITPQTEAKLKAGNITGFMIDAFAQLGLQPLAKQRGITDANAKACLSDKLAMQKIISMTEESSTKYAINSTPAFLIDDKLTPHAHDLASIQTAIKAK
jgi:protein-disulfide isomerase